MTVSRATVDPEAEELRRLERARHDLELWGRWIVMRGDGGVGYGESCLSNLQRAGRSADHYQAPINETHCSWIDTIVRRLGRESHLIATMHFGRGFSYNFIARSRKMAWATVERRIAEVVRAVAYPATDPQAPSATVM